MIHYIDVGLSNLEVPYETTICFYISGCRNNCINCHFKELRSTSSGDVLDFKRLHQMIQLYVNQASCVCFMGEGDESYETKNIFSDFVNIIHEYNLKACLYSGRDTDVESWMHCFDYVKTGSYIEKMGALTSKRTNQRMYKKVSGRFINITNLFWEDYYNDSCKKEY